MTDPRNCSELRVLQAVRLAGVADDTAILDRALVADDEGNRVIAHARATNRIEPLTFADTAGWILTDLGSRRLAALLRDELVDNQATTVLETTLESFEPLNATFVSLVGGWQLRSTSPTTTGFGGADAGQIEDLLHRLDGIGTDLRTTLAGLIGVLPRFGRYPSQYTAAVARARHDGLRWVTGVGLMSCHVVWAELHQDLLSSLGRDRHDDRRGR